ncbi:uncharacterized protein YALI1_A16303g [Yarrowia lipolytica]|uniref:Uncharacterized protein n=1 Tax=Yarrowia lipolytica TaxID=4952 RepID=A0A1D8N507_YARLL|nr:hypothetical protein YALI1_A16303g [Yarrowia lipolytica]
MIIMNDELTCVLYCVYSTCSCNLQSVVSEHPTSATSRTHTCMMLTPSAPRNRLYHCKKPSAKVWCDTCSARQGYLIDITVFQH